MGAKGGISPLVSSRSITKAPQKRFSNKGVVNDHISESFGFFPSPTHWEDQVLFDFFLKPATLK
jgi:hypothetical protein